ncbi:transglycosylase domain-containing protein [Candidatus Parcubacteria bacterium]|nr:transglycosylase domain-containing protein [Candidatus Parcubacteria bacterium]
MRFNNLTKKKIAVFCLALFALFLVGFLCKSNNLTNEIVSAYKTRQSFAVYDRQNELVYLRPNTSGYWAEYGSQAPDEFKRLLLIKEDKYFYYHPGVNPVSTMRAFKNYILRKDNLTSSTITQQLVKIILATEAERNFKNKFKEAIYALGLELRLDKDEILQMYVNSIYLGNKTQGIKSASRLYFGVAPEMLTDIQIIQLLAAISNPSHANPFSKNTEDNISRVSKLLDVDLNQDFVIKESEKKQHLSDFADYTRKDTYFELENMGTADTEHKQLSIDHALTDNIRELLQTNLQILIEKDAANGAVVVIKMPENELLAIVGTPYPALDTHGYQINMATRPRPIGSTVKPFIYVKGFEKDLRPFTRVEDKEYKYIINSGFAFYPKNYDYEYRGEVDLHYALSNSLNVPTVKVFEHVGINNFSEFLLFDLVFSPVQPIENYQLSIALGGLEMDLLALSYYFTIFPNNGYLKPLKLYQNGGWPDYQTTSDFRQDTKCTPGAFPAGHPLGKRIVKEKYIQLINKILSDRKTGIEQFGMKSNLNLPYSNYAVKTGTSRDFHDSWTIGYTPDFLVGVWVGNSANTPMNKVSGQSGAGRVWQDVMNLLYNSEHNKQTAFKFNLITEFNENGNLVYGLPGDAYSEHVNLLLDNKLIINPHNGDIFLLEEGMGIFLKSERGVEWYVDGVFFEQGREVIFSPVDVGKYMIKAVVGGEVEEVLIFVDEE